MCDIVHVVGNRRTVKQVSVNYTLYKQLKSLFKVNYNDFSQEVNCSYFCIVLFSCSYSLKFNWQKLNWKKTLFIPFVKNCFYAICSNIGASTQIQIIGK